VKAGDKISVTIHPLSDGGGQYMSVVLPNGQTLSNPSRRAGAADELRPRLSKRYKGGAPRGERSLKIVTRARLHLRRAQNPPSRQFERDENRHFGGFPR
jgi:hypothetical protein